VTLRPAWVGIRRADPIYTVAAEHKGSHPDELSEFYRIRLLGSPRSIIKKFSRRAFKTWTRSLPLVNQFSDLPVSRLRKDFTSRSAVMKSFEWFLNFPRRIAFTAEPHRFPGFRSDRAMPYRGSLYHSSEWCFFTCLPFNLGKFSVIDRKFSPNHRYLVDPPNWET
jgi:hypothetical protein